MLNCLTHLCHCLIRKYQNMHAISKGHAKQQLLA
uniref:Uncharacterized protein n=1 Tax=Arundo donax TaxID=35708 RepID=A0A0A9ARS4_ARUDO